MAIGTISVSAYKYNKPSNIQLVDASQAAKSLAQKTLLLISKKGASCVSFGDRLKLRKLLRLVPWATEFEHHVAQNLGKAHLPKSMKSQSFPVESYISVCFEQQKSVHICCCVEAFMFNAHQPAEAPFTSQGSQDLVKLLPIWGSSVSLSDLILVTLDNLYFTSDVLQMIARETKPHEWYQYQIDGN